MWFSGGLDPKGGEWEYGKSGEKIGNKGRESSLEKKGTVGRGIFGLASPGSLEEGSCL